MAVEQVRTAAIADATDITDRPAESLRPGVSNLGVAGAVPFVRVPEGSRTIRSSERVPAGTPSGDADTAGGWLPSLTLALGGTTRMKIPRSFIFGCLLVVGLFITSGCTTKRTASGERIYFTQTAAYDQKVRTFALTEQQARERVAEFVRTERGTNAPQKIFIGDHIAIVGDCFVFSPPRKADVSLGGYYVDGHTGQVTQRSEGYTTLPLLRK